MPFDKAEARLKTIKKLQAQLNEFERGCYPRKEQKTYTIDAHSFDKAMKDLMRVTEENKKLKKYETMIHNVWSELYWKDKDGEDVGWKDISQCVDYDEEFVKKEVVDDELKEENKKLKEGFEEMTHDEIMYSHEWVEWKEYREKCQRFIYRRNQQTNTKC